MKHKLPRMPFILVSLIIVLLAAMAGEFFSQPIYNLYGMKETPWDYFVNHPIGTINQALDNGRLFSGNRKATVARGYGALAGVVWLFPMVFFARRPGGESLVRFRNFLKLLFAGVLAGIFVGAICGGLVHLYIHTLEGIRELPTETKWSGVYVGLIFGSGAGAILGLLGGWQMWAVQLAALSGWKANHSSPSSR